MKPLSTLVGALILALSGPALAQSQEKQDAGELSAPRHSSHAAGHDSQSGKPETGEDLVKEQEKKKRDSNARKDTKKEESPK